MATTSLSSLEDSTLRYVLTHAGEGQGWLDLTRVCSTTGRMLPDVRDAVMKLARRRLLLLDEKAPHTARWMKFSLPETPRPTAPREPVV